MVRVAGFEPATAALQMRGSTGLSYTLKTGAAAPALVAWGGGWS